MKELPKRRAYIKDARITGDTIRFVSDRDVSFEELYRDLGKAYRYVRVPGFLGREEGEEPHFTSEDYDCLQRELEQAGIRDVRIKLEFKDRESGFDRSGLNRPRQEAAAAGKGTSGEDAYVCNGPLDWARFPYRSLKDLLKARKNSRQKLVYIQADREEEQTYGQLYKRAVKLALAMRQAGINRGDKVLFQLAENRNFIECFWACMLLGAGVAPVNRPMDYRTEDVDTDKLAGIAASFGRTVILTEEESRSDALAFINARGLDCRPVSIEELDADQWPSQEEEERLLERSVFSFDEPCLFLFTSGSTGNPKGVGLSAKQIFARNLGEIQQYGLDETLSDFNWMTLNHAAGLVWSHIRDIQLDAFQVQARTEVILQDPLKLPAYLDRFRSTTSWAPNFAYAMVAGAVDESADYGWELSRVTNLYSGGEMNVNKSLREFLRRMRKYGMSASCLIPCFGMTETASCVTYENGFFCGASKAGGACVPVGTPAAGVEARIADKKGRLLKKGEVGYLQIKGDPVIGRYYNNPQADLDSFSRDGFLITGDLAYIEENTIVITGREKDVVIVNGENHYVQDIETAADDLPEVRSGFTSLISVMEERGEAIILFFSPEREDVMDEGSVNELRSLIRRVKSAIQTKCFVTLDHLIPVRPEDFPRTEIGKKQRNRLKQAYQEGVYEAALRTLEERRPEYVLTKTYAQVEPGAAAEQEEGDCRTVLDFTFAETAGIYGEEAFSGESVRNTFEQVLAFLAPYAEKGGRGKQPAQNRIRVIVPVLYRKKEFSLLPAVLPSMLRTFSLENPNIVFKAVFLQEPDRQLIQREAESADGYEAVWYRDGKRYIDSYRMVNCRCDRNRAAAMLEGHIAVVAGGLGGIGKHLCRYLLETYKEVKVLVTGRRPEKAAEAFLAEYSSDRILYRQADLCSYQQLRGACEDAKAYWGLPLGCVFHLAARSVRGDEELSIAAAAEKNRIELYTESAEVKLIGLRNADRIRIENNCRLYVFGSVAADFGMIHMAAYGAANLLAEKYCEYKQDPNLIYLAWSGWSGVGMNLKKTSEDMKQFIHDFDMDRNGFLQAFTPETGVRMIDSVLCSGLQNGWAGMDTNFSGIQYCVHDRWDTCLTLLFRNREDLMKGQEILTQTDYRDRGLRVSCLIDKLDALKKSGAPEELREAVKEVWQSALGIDELGLNDNLFDVGGNSLTVFRIISDLKERLALEAKPIDIMMYSTVQSFAQYIAGSGEEEIRETEDREIGRTGKKRKLKKRERVETSHELDR